MQSKYCFADDVFRLDDLQAYDNATRGPAGATLFLWHFRKAPIVTYFAAVGCLLTIVGLAVEPFLQQSLSFYTRWTEVKTGPTAILPYAVAYDNGATKVGSAAIVDGVGFDIGIISLSPSSLFARFYADDCH